MSVQARSILVPTVFLALCTVIGIWAVLYERSIVCGGSSCDGPPQVGSSIRTTLTGTYLCLPHKDPNISQTEPCVPGLHTHDGAYYALHLELLSQEYPPLASNDSITATGVMTPVEALSSSYWWNYSIRGIFSVTDSLIVHK